MPYDRRYGPPMEYVLTDKERRSVDHSLYTDPRRLDRSEPERILSLYPALWREWQRRMDDPDALKNHWTGGIRAMHDPRFLRDVVNQYRHITEGPGDPPPPPAAAERIVRALSRSPKTAKYRAEFLGDPWARANRPNQIEREYDPMLVEAQVEMDLEYEDPMSKASLERKAFWQSLAKGGVMEIADDSGEVIAEIPLSGDDRRSASRNN